MAAYVPTGTDPLVIGSQINCALLCGQCQTVLERQRIKVHASTDREVAVAMTKAVASDLFTEDEYNALSWDDFVPHEFGRDASGKPLIIAKGASIDKTAKIRGPVVIDKHSSVGPRTVVGPYVGLTHAKIDNDVVLEDCRVIHAYVGEQNRIEKAVLKNTVIPGGRFRHGIR
jgi:UDP-3-O-[3-hydroxymyristoyl] glucosamine N-acyltransferase